MPRFEPVGLKLCLAFTMLIADYHRAPSCRVMTPPKFPRRCPQRQALALHHGGSTTTPSKASSSHKRSQEHKPPYKEGRREAAVHSNTASTIEPYYSPNSLSDDKSESDYESDQDTGYCSSSNDAKANYYCQMRAQFTAEGPVMADLSEASKATIKTKERNRIGESLGLTVIRQQMSLTTRAQTLPGPKDCNPRGPSPRSLGQGLQDIPPVTERPLVYCEGE
jgi:hypothetical protein